MCLLSQAAICPKGFDNVQLREEILDIFSSLLRTVEPKKIKYKLDLFNGIDPVSWAVNICQKNANTGALTLQAMESAFENRQVTTNDKALDFDSANAVVVEGDADGDCTSSCRSR